MTDSGRRPARLRGVTRAIADRRPGEVAGPRPDRRQLLEGCSRSRHTMNVQRCWFLLLPARRPAWRIRSRWAASSGRSANARMARFVAIADQTGSSVGRASALEALGGRRRPVGARRPGRPGQATWASVRNPPGVSHGVEAGLAVGDALGRRRRSRSAGLVGRQRAIERAGEEAGDGPR